MSKDTKSLVNPISVAGCSVRIGDVQGQILDLSFVRLVVTSDESWASVPEDKVLPIVLQLGTVTLEATAKIRAKNDAWIRLSFESIRPIARAHLRSFLSPKKIGESIIEDWSTDDIRHFHGLNEAELWFEPNGAVLFTYLDPLDTQAQFMIRMAHSKSALVAGKILRKDYIELSTIDGELPLIPLDDSEIYSKLGECRDIVTNFRPNAQLEYNLKQRLHRVISEYLYSTSRKVEMTRMGSARTLSLNTQP